MATSDSPQARVISPPGAPAARDHLGRRPWRTLVVALVVFLLLAAALAVALLLVHPKPPAQARGPLAPRAGALLGAYTKPESGSSRADLEADVRRLERQIGRKLAIDHHFREWNGPLPSWADRWDAAHARIPMVSVESISVDRINDGSEDGLLRRHARALAAFGKPLFLRPFHEMDSGHARRFIDTPAAFVDAWRRMHRIFEHQGATNVVWVWCPNASAFATGRAQSFYPGDDVVDWVCADGYNWSPLLPGGHAGGEWESFADIFEPFYRWALDSGKPIMIGETGAQEGAPGQKADWIADMAASLRTRFTRVRALLYFNAIAGSNTGGVFDWRVDTSPSALRAFRSLAGEPYFRPSLQTSSLGP